MAHVLITFICLLMYHETLFYGFSIDDRNLEKTYNDKEDFYRKPSLSFRYIFNLFYGGRIIKNLFLDHLLTLSLFTFLCNIVYVFLGNSIESFVTTVLFSLSPANAQLSVWLNGRRYIVSAILVLSAWILAPVGSLLLLVAPIFQISSIPVFIMFLFSKFWYVSLLSVITYFICSERINETIKFRSKLIIGEVGKFMPVKKFPVLIKTISYYITRCLFPHRIYFHSAFLQKYGIDEAGYKDAYSRNKEFYVGLAKVGCLFVIGICNYDNQIGFGVLWFFVFTSIWSNLITRTMYVADRYLCISSIGLLYSFICFIHKMPQELSLVLTVSLSSFYVFVLARDMVIFKNIDCFYRYQWNECPEIIHNTFQYVKALIKANDPMMAFVVVRQTINRFPFDFRMNLMMSKVLFALGLKKEARPFLDRASDQIKNQCFQKHEELKTWVDQMKRDIK